MALFNSIREKRLWIVALSVVLTIYASIWITRPIVDALRDRGLFDNAFIISFFLIGASLLFYGLKTKKSKYEIWFWIGVGAAYFMAFARIANPVERTHLMEFGVVAILVLEAFKERPFHTAKPWIAPVLAFCITCVVGAIDECIQAFVPSRVFDIQDMGFNAIAAFMAISSSVILSWIRNQFSKEKSS